MDSLRSLWLIREGNAEILEHRACKPGVGGRFFAPPTPILLWASKEVQDKRQRAGLGTGALGLLLPLPLSG